MNGRLLIGLTVAALLIGAGAVYLRDRDDEAHPSVARGEVQPFPDPVSDDYRSVETADGYKYWPRSAELDEGVLYEFNTGHCGLNFLTDFDGSFWIPHHEEGTREPDFFFNEDQGTIRVITPDRALYHSSEGEAALLTRHEGPLTEEVLCR